MSTTEQLNTQDLEESSTRITDWWRLDGAIEKVKQLWASMSQRENERGPEDYEVTQAEVRKMMRGLGHLLARPQINTYNEGGDNGGRALQKWILGVLSTLTVAAIVGSFTLYGRLTSLEATVANIAVNYDSRLRRLEDINERRYRGGEP